MAIIDQLDLVLADQLRQNLYSNESTYSDIVGPGAGSKLEKQAVPVQGDLSRNLYDNGSPSIGARGGSFSLNLPGPLGFVDVFATAHWLRGIGKELFGSINLDQKFLSAAGSVVGSKGFQFVTSQFLLSSMNPTDPEVGGLANATWNPLSLPAAALPGMRPSDLTATTVGAATTVPFLRHDPTTSRIDKYVEITKNLGAAGINKEYDALGPGKPSKLASLFGSKGFSGFDAVKEAAAKMPTRSPKDTPALLHAKIVEAPDGDEDGIIENNPPADNQIYMPLSFQDLRDSVPTWLYFRAFIKEDSISETFTPEWSPSRYYGRVDQIPVYMGTTRIINFSFDVVAFQPADLRYVYRKLHKLQSMVYPMFDSKGFMSAGPIIRLRLGDLFSSKAQSTNKRGLSGYITSLDISYDNVWNIEADFKVPRKATISLSFTALHEGNPGIYQGSRADKKLATFGTGEQVGTDPNDDFIGAEEGFRGLLINMKRDKEGRGAGGNKVASPDQGNVPSTQGT